MLPLAGEEHPIPGHEDVIEQRDAGRLAVPAAEDSAALARALPPEPNWWAPAALIVVAAAARAPRASPTGRRALLLSVLLPTAIATAHTESV